MNKHYLMSQMKSVGTAYLCWCFFACHYAYLGKWKTQILFWCTFGGLGIWTLIDLFRVGGMVNKHNAVIAEQIQVIEDAEKEEAHARNLAMISAAANKTA